jgi:hypothetical protein
MNIKRYHIDVNFPKEHKKMLENFVKKINSQNFTFTKHCIDRLFQQVLSEQKVKEALFFIKNLTFKYANIFEYYTEVGHMSNEKMRKACFRVSYKENTDIILVIGINKELITVYVNDKNDEHITLNKNLYVKN